VCIFGLIQKCTKKIKPVKKWPDALLHATEISQTLPTAVGIKHEKFRPFCSEEHPGDHFFKADGSFFRLFEANLVESIRRLIPKGHKD